MQQNITIDLMDLRGSIALQELTGITEKIGGRPVVIAQFQEQDKDHLQAMKEKMQDPQAMQTGMEEKKKEFDDLPEDN